MALVEDGFEDGIEEWRDLGNEIVETAESFLLFAIQEDGTVVSCYPVREGTDDRQKLLDVVKRYVASEEFNLGH